MQLVVKNNELNVLYDSGETEIMQCSIGKNGFASYEDKFEGDGKTPIGEYELLRVFYRKDKLDEIKIDLPKKVITEADGWCDDKSCEEYNQYVELPFEGSYENLWKDDIRYDVVIQLSHNTPAVMGKGSAIFFHIASEDYAPTMGCVAISKVDMLRLLPSFKIGTTIEILAP